ncbi:hypothetical protein [Clostridium butyricum]|uniref:hypothetical protein n=1 Tax=Clostridium butyricum TaxID=1492 RepID=UPI00325BA226
MTAYCGTINALKKLGKDWKDISLNDIYKTQLIQKAENMQAEYYMLINYLKKRKL